MGNTKSSQSSFSIANSFDKETLFNNIEDDDGGFLQSHLDHDNPTIKRDKYSRKSLSNVRNPSNQENGSMNAVEISMIKRVNSLPSSRIKKNKEKSSTKETEPYQKRIPVQGFDLFRHHLGQMNCDLNLFKQLESDLQTLNDKLTEIEQLRLNCVDKLIKLENDIQLNRFDNINIRSNHKNKQNKSNDLALIIIRKYIQRIETLMNVDDEPFMMNIKLMQNDLKRTNSKENVLNSLQQIKSSSHIFEQSIDTTKRTCSDESGVMARVKRQQIKDAYNQLIQEIMPKMFGKQFDHNDDLNYKEIKSDLEQLRNKIYLISSSDEQRLVDAKRIFMQEIDGYLRTLHDMVRCDPNVSDCDKCKP
ncbi:hypothetical protein RDWZM_000487 [Blomia tropicalis]|uniref:Uncharacterized protein n=1 Tax=Blomia tropicalis TaxID=40697 RepID=A0A9Q0MCW3_BLOTA|nr:hypothetical protein RDWZM_000487 [Blomia tropicalis]